MMGSTEKEMNSNPTLKGEEQYAKESLERNSTHLKMQPHLKLTQAMPNGGTPNPAPLET
jgi:hypothetical protein